MTTFTALLRRPYTNLQWLDNQERNLITGNTIATTVSVLSKRLVRHWISVLVTLVISGLPVVAALGIQVNMRESARRDMEKSLTTVVETTQQALVTWFKDHQSDARFLASSKPLRAYTLELLAAHRNKDDLLAAEAQEKVRNWFAPILQAKDHTEFILITPDGINFASTRGASVGARNLLLQQEGLFKKISGGETLLSLPFRSDVSLPDNQGGPDKGLTTMFVGAPIRDEASRVIATLLLRIDLQQDFSPLLQRGRIGTSGETYAFDSRGKMISDSRHIPQLIEAGLLPPESTTSLGLELRNPTVNLMTGETPPTQAKDRPLTDMAKSATNGESGQNLVGYQDYRGVPVVGAWVWIEDLNLGITTEIDVEEAYETLSNNVAIMRSTTLLLLGLIIPILLISGASRHHTSASELRYKSLFNNTNDAIVILDSRSRKVIDANAKATQQLGYTPAELSELGIRDLFNKEEADDVLVQWAKLEAEGSVVFETNVLRKDGSILFAEVSITLAELEERAVFQAFFRDVGQRKSLEEKLSHSQRMETVGTLAGGVAHNFNNLLMPIIGNAQLIVANIDDKSNLTAYAERIVGAGNRASALVDQLLTIGRQQKTEMIPIALAPLVEEAISLLQTSISPSILLSTDIDETCGKVKADASQLHQAIMNLCINASHAMEETGNELRISLQPVEADDTLRQMVDSLEEGGYVRLSISDAGKGMDENTRRKIFDPFFSTKEHGKGTGLGLSTVHNIVASHGGHITVNSQPGVGSTFDVYLPLAEPATIECEPTRHVAKGGGEHILVVDDNADVAEVISDILEQLGYKITVANNGADALGIFEVDPGGIDLVITDFAMPNMDGSDLVRRIRAIQHDTRVVMMSGFRAALSGSDIASLGVLKLLNKPFTREQLDETIASAFDRNSRLH